MLRLFYAFATFLALVSFSTMAFAQAAFVEGHVFNKRTGEPLPGATVRVSENVTAGPLPVELAAGITDANGFYQFEIDEFLGFPATIEVVCETARREIRGRSSAVLRDGLIRRDVYLGATRRISRCGPMVTPSCIPLPTTSSAVALTSFSTNSS